MLANDSVAQGGGLEKTRELGFEFHRQANMVLEVETVKTGVGRHWRRWRRARSCACRLNHANSLSQILAVMGFPRERKNYLTWK
jgi:hypothetical protein